MISIPEGENNYTYILKCADGTFYTGWTNDLNGRLASHNSGKGSKYTRTRCPVELVYYEISPTKEEAMSREWHIKQLSRKQKERLVGMCEIPTTVYIADASALDDKELFDKLYEKASSDRKKKADAMRRKADKNLSLAAETLLDIALSENKIDIKKLVFGNGKNGKPEIISRNNLYFNLSHSGDMVMCIISDVPVGCDVERTEKPVKNIAGHFFSPAENEFLGKISDETAKKDMFFRIWTLKESFIKNIGTGLAYPLKNFSIIPGKDEIILEQTYDENSYCLREFEFDQNYKYSVCVFGNEKRKINMHYIELEGLNV